MASPTTNARTAPHPQDRIDLGKLEDHEHVAEVVVIYRRTIVEVVHVGQQLEAYTIGESPAASFKVGGANLPNPAATPLIRRVDGGFTLTLVPGMGGVVELGGVELRIDELVDSGRALACDGCHVYRLVLGARARISLGEVRFDVKLVRRGAVVAGRGRLDRPFLAALGGAATVAIAFHALMSSLPEDALAVELAEDEAAARFAAYFHQADEPVEPEPIEDEVEPVASSKSPGQASKAANEPGTEGSRGASVVSVRGSRNAVPRMTRGHDPIVAARNAGILGILAAQDGQFLASADGGPFNVGIDDGELWQAVNGLELADLHGPGGLSPTSTGRPGGGVANGVIDYGGTGLLDHGTGFDGSRYDHGGGGFSKRKKVAVVAVPKGEVVGYPDRDLIRRIIRARINEVRSCYNAGLARNPTLEGRVVVQFSIVGTGKVGSAVVKESSLADGEVGDCIAKAVKRWKFPRVGGGGTAVVTYPFRLTAH